MGRMPWPVCWWIYSIIARNSVGFGAENNCGFFKNLILLAEGGDFAAQGARAAFPGVEEIGAYTEFFGEFGDWPTKG